MRYVVKWMKENLLSEREEMFGEGDGVYVFGFLDFLHILCDGWQQGSEADFDDFF